MASVLIRDIDDAVLARVKRRARERNHSLQAELKIMVNNLAGTAEPLSELELIRKIRNSNTKINKTDSVDLLREDRDR